MDFGILMSSFQLEVFYGSKLTPRTYIKLNLNQNHYSSLPVLFSALWTLRQENRDSS